MAVPHGSTALTNPEKINTSAKITLHKATNPFLPLILQQTIYLFFLSIFFLQTLFRQFRHTTGSLSHKLPNTSCWRYWRSAHPSGFCNRTVPFSATWRQTYPCSCHRSLPLRPPRNLISQQCPDTLCGFFMATEFGSKFSFRVPLWVHLTLI